MRVWTLLSLTLVFASPAHAQPSGLAGSVPNGFDVPGVPLMLDKTPLGEVTLSWGASCLVTDTDYEIYEGPLGDFASHAPRLCSTGGNTSRTIPPDEGDRYYLIVSRTDTREGAYGADSNRVGRPRGTAT